MSDAEIRTFEAFFHPRSREMRLLDTKDLGQLVCNEAYASSLEYMRNDSPEFRSARNWSRLHIENPEFTGQAARMIALQELPAPLAGDIDSRLHGAEGVAWLFVTILARLGELGRWRGLLQNVRWHEMLHLRWQSQSDSGGSADRTQFSKTTRKALMEGPRQGVAYQDRTRALAATVQRFPVPLISLGPPATENGTKTSDLTSASDGERAVPHPRAEAGRPKEELDSFRMPNSTRCGLIWGLRTGDIKTAEKESAIAPLRQVWTTIYKELVDSIKENHIGLDVLLLPRPFEPVLDGRTLPPPSKNSLDPLLMACLDCPKIRNFGFIRHFALAWAWFLAIASGLSPTLQRIILASHPLGP